MSSTRQTNKQGDRNTCKALAVYRHDVADISNPIRQSIPAGGTAPAVAAQWEMHSMFSRFHKV